MNSSIRVLFASVFSLIMLSACSANTPNPTPAPNTSDTPQQVASPDQGADTPDQAISCVEACVTRNQMRAVAIEDIRQDCATECDQGTPQPGL